MVLNPPNSAATTAVVAFITHVAPWPSALFGAPVAQIARPVIVASAMAAVVKDAKT